MKPPAHRSAGLQAERTVLAWSRTALSAAALSGVSIKAARGDAAGLVCSALAALAAAVLYLLAQMRRRRPTTIASTGIPVAAVVCCAAILAAAMLVLRALLVET